MEITKDFVDVFLGDDTIYHYTTAYVALEKILYDKQLRLSPFKFSNDPREYKRWSFGSGGWGLTAFNAESLERLVLADEKTNKILRNRYKIACFTTNSNSLNDSMEIFEKGFAKSRMWSQYGAGHYGVSLGFSKSALLKALTKGHHNKSVFGRHVEYKKRRDVDVDARTFNSNILSESQDLNEFAVAHIRDKSDKIFFEKGIDYQEEAEYRLVVEDPENEYVFISTKKCLNCIVLGDRFHNTYVSSVKKLCSRPKVPCKRLYWHSGTAMLTDSLEV